MTTREKAYALLDELSDAELDEIVRRAELLNCRLVTLDARAFAVERSGWDSWLRPLSCRPLPQP